jgi:hypothetical protein
MSESHQSSRWMPVPFCRFCHMQNKNEWLRSSAKVREVVFVSASANEKELLVARLTGRQVKESAQVERWFLF